MNFLRRRRLALFIGLWTSFTGVKAQFVINELMQSNVDVLMDDTNQFPDSWVEIYNPMATARDLRDYRINNTRDFQSAHKLAACSVPSKGYALIYCDKDHTGFRLDSDAGGGIYLYNPMGQLVNCVVDIGRQPAPNTAFGRTEDGGSEWAYLTQPTPAASNSTASPALGLLPAPEFSRKGFVASTFSSFSLRLSLPADAPQGTVVRYTTDGSEPTEQSARYISPLLIPGSTVVRAKSFCPGYLSPRAATQSYLMLGRDVTLPVVSIATDRRYFYDDRIGILVDGNYSDSQRNYQFNWRRPANFEVFWRPDEPSVVNQLGETRCAGAASRGFARKSLAIYAHKRFGKKRFRHEFFPTQRPGQTEFKSLLLRNSGNDFDYLYFRDAAIQHNMGSHCDLDWQAWQPAIVFINGQYYGMLNLRERSNEDNIYSNYDGLEDIDMIENWWETKKGTDEEFRRFKDYYIDGSHTDMDGYATQMDIEEYTNLMIMNIYYNNLDFPGNNIVQWRRRSGGDTRWRWMAKDVDYAMGIYDESPSYPIFMWYYDHDYDPDHNWANYSDNTRLFRRLMSDPRYEQLFLDRMLVYMGDFMNAATMNATLDSMHAVIQYEYPHHRKLVNQWWPNYAEVLQNAKDWNTDRQRFMYSHLAEHFGLGKTFALTVNQSLGEDAALTRTAVNETPLTRGRFDGKFFVGRELRLSADPGLVSGWQLRRFTTSGSLVTEQYSGSALTLTLPANTISAAFTAVADFTPVELPRQTHESDAAYDLQGRRIAQPVRRGIYIQGGRKMVK